jgi:dTDP-4-dehydrorhamnose reductase
VKILLIGANGQLGTDLQKKNPGHQIVPLTHADLDVVDAARVQAALREHSPQAVISTAAYHRTDECEDFPEKAFQVNILGPRNLGRACAAIGARLVHYSSDYVFDGLKRLPYCESDRPAPLSVYGISKLGGEHAALAASDRHMVLRVASLFGSAGSAGKGGNFVELIVKRAREGQPVEVVDDMIMSPTYTLDLAEMTWTLLDREAPGGLYHVTNSGTASWYEFARKFLSLLDLPAPKAIRSADRPAKIRRPLYSAMRSERLPELGIQPLRVWQEAVRAYLIEKGHLKS